MHKLVKSNRLALAIGLLVGSQSSYALTLADGAPELIVYTSGGAAQDKAIAKVVQNTLAAPNTLDTFSDSTASGTVGGRWQAFYFTGNANLGAGLAGKRIILEKRSYGAAGYGVIPLFANNGDGIPLEHLDITGTTAGDWTANGSKQWKAVIDNSNAAKFLTNVVSDGGFLGVDPDVLLKPATENYPEQVNELKTAAPEPNWPLDISKAPAGFTVQNTGGLVYGVAVTKDLYKVLQAAQKLSGALPASVTIGEYNDAALPSVSRTFLASLLAGKVGDWSQISVVDKTTANAGSAVPLDDPSILAAAGISTPPIRTVVGIGRRNKGAAIGAVAYAKLLNYPAVARANPPASDTVPGDEGTAAPLVKSPGGASATDSLLIDWASGTNVSGLNPGNQVIWGLAVNSGDRDPGASADGATAGKPWRYIKVDGYAPTIENVASGSYPLWAEGSVLYRTDKPDAQWASKKALLKAFADDLGSPVVAKAINPTLTFGISGIFATTKDPRGFIANVPFDPLNPVVALSHNCVGTTNTSTSIVPVADDLATNGLKLQLK